MEKGWGVRGVVVQEQRGWPYVGRGWAEGGSRPQAVPVGRVVRVPTCLWSGSDGLLGRAETPQSCFAQGCAAGGWHSHGAHARARLEAGWGGLDAVPWVPPSPPSPGAGLWEANGSISAASAPQHPSAARFMGCSEASLSLSPELINSLAIGARAN